MRLFLLLLQGSEDGLGEVRGEGPHVYREEEAKNMSSFLTLSFDLNQYDARDNSAFITPFSY